MNTDDYRSHIDRLIREMSGETVLNGSHAHATIIIERMLANATRSVSILSRRFDPRIYGTQEAVSQAELLLGDRDRSINILLEDVDPTELAEHPFFERLGSHLGRNLCLRQMPEHLKAAVAINFSIMDDSSFRLEQDKHQAVAIARFGDRPFTARLQKFFHSIWEHSSDVRLAVAA